MGFKPQIVINNDKGLDVTAMMGPRDSIVPYVLVEVIYYPKPLSEDSEPFTVREWTYQNIEGAFFLAPRQLRDDFRYADLAIKSPRNMQVGYVELPRTEYPKFEEGVRRAFHTHSVNVRKEWNWIHHHEEGWDKWMTFEQFLKEKKDGRPLWAPSHP